LAWVADRLRDAVDHGDRPDVGQRLYVSRAGQSDRNVVNEAELRSTLAAHGFEIVKPEAWSLPRQVAAFADAEAVCGPHGAGLVNFVYADDSATLLELFGTRTNPCFYAIAAGLGRRYAVHRATAEEDHIRVDPGRLADLLGLLDDQSQLSAELK
jgi:capsular polysaccharide biosynthesis protein